MQALVVDQVAAGERVRVVRDGAAPSRALLGRKLRKRLRIRRRRRHGSQRFRPKMLFRQIGHRLHVQEMMQIDPGVRDVRTASADTSWRAFMLKTSCGIT